jgi:hypothetical protein
MNKTEELRKLLINRFAQTVEYGAMCEECCSNQGHTEQGEECEMVEKPLQPDDHCPQALECIDSVIPDIEKIYRMNNTWCAYCGKEFPLDTVTADQVGEHIKTCEKHPLYQANKEIVRLREGWTHCTDLCQQYEKRIAELEAEKMKLQLLADMRQT